MTYQRNMSIGDRSDGASELRRCEPQNTPDYDQTYMGTPHSLKLQMNVNVPDHHVLPNASNFVIKDSTFVYGGFPQGSFSVFRACSFEGSHADKVQKI
jgi:hypothetical protein